MINVSLTITEGKPNPIMVQLRVISPHLIGKDIILVGLKKTELNAKIGSIKGIKDKRYIIEVRGERNCLLIKPENVVELKKLNHLQDPDNVRKEDNRTKQIRDLSKFDITRALSHIFEKSNGGPYYVVSGHNDPLPQSVTECSTFIHPCTEIAMAYSTTKRPIYPLSLQNLRDAVNQKKMAHKGVILWNITTSLRSADHEETLTTIRDIVGRNGTCYLIRDSNATPELIFEMLKKKNEAIPNKNEKLFMFPFYDKDKEEKGVFFTSCQNISEQLIIKMSKALGVSYYCLLDYMEKPSPTKYNQLFETLGSFEAVKKLSAFLLKEEIGSNKKEIILLNELRDQEDCRLLNDNGFELTADYTKLSITEPHGLPGYKLHVKVFKTGVVQKLQKG